MNHAQLGLNGEAVLAEVEQLVAPVFPQGQGKDRASHGVHRMGGSMGIERLAAERGCTEEIDRQPKARIGQAAPIHRARLTVQQALPAGVPLGQTDIETSRPPEQVECSKE
jgi:hypothetical protein